jgi:2-isopropylmalate synthase
MSGSHAFSNGEEKLVVDPREYTQHIARPDPCKLRIYDTTLRDGEQTPGVAIPPEEKYLIARELSELGCHILDVGFPASAPSECEALRKILTGRKKGELRPDVEILVTCRAVRDDIDRAVEAIRHIGYSPGEVSFLVFSSASGLHCKYKLGPTLLARIRTTIKDFKAIPVEEFYEANKAMVSEAIQHALARGVGKVEFGAEDASRTPVHKLVELVRAAAKAGASRYLFADTTGSLTPEAMRRYCEALKAQFPDLELASHCHVEQRYRDKE